MLLIVFLIALFPDVQSQGPALKPQPDYGIYGALEDIQDEKNSRINTPDVLNETKSRFENITITSGEERFDLEAGREVVSPDIPVPDMLDIYDAMMEWDKTHSKELIDWLIPQPIGNGSPLNYYIFTRYINSSSIVKRWTNASLRPNLGFTRGAMWDPVLDMWYPVDVDDDGVDDIEVFFEPSLNSIRLGDIFGGLGDLTLNIGATLYYRIRKLNDAPFNTSDFQNMEVYITKYISYSDQNFILFLGLNLTNIVSYLDCRVEIDTVEISNILGSINLSSFTIDTADLLNLYGPYILEWDSDDEDLDSLSLEIATAKMLFDPSGNYEFINRSWVDIDFYKQQPNDASVPRWGRLKVDAEGDFSSFDKIEWRAELACDAHLRFFDSQENVSFAELNIDDLPDEVNLYMTVQEQGDKDITVIDYDAHGVIKYLKMYFYEYFDTSYENITKSRIDSGQVEYVHIFFNITNIPRELHIEGIFSLEEIEDPPPANPGIGITSDLLDAMSYRVISRFTRIAKTLASIPYKLISMAEEGSLATIDTHDKDDIDEIEFIYTSGDYVTTDGNYFAFYNQTRPSQYPIAQVSLSARISKIMYINASFEEYAVAEIKMMSGERFRAIYADDINSLNAEINISNIPGSIFIFKSPDRLRYNGNSKIDEVRFISEYGDSYMDFKINDLSDYIYVEFEDNRTYVSSGSSDKNIGEIEFLVTTGPIMRMNGNHLLLRQHANYSLLSGGIKDISNLEYITGDMGKITIHFTDENPINISLYDDRNEIISADLILDPMPSDFSVNLSGLFANEGPVFSLPQLETTGVMGFASLIFGISTLGNEILRIVDESAQGALENVGQIIEDLSFAYSTTTHITLIGMILKGNGFTFDDVDWVHGISARQETYSDGGTSMAAKLYLSGLPTEGSIITRMQGDDIFLDFSLEDYQPLHNWLLIDVRGLRDRDAMLYLNDIPTGMDLNLKVNLSATLNSIPQRATGSIHMDSDKSIGSIYGRLRQKTSEITVSEVFLDSIPRNLDLDFNLSGNVGIHYKANIGIEHLFVKNSKTRDGEFHDIYAILHELPDELQIEVLPVTDYDMDGSLLQTLPTLSMYTSGDTLDAYIFADGKGIGQVGIVELQVVNAPMTLSGKFSDDKYSVTSTGVDYMWVHVMDMPVMEDHETKSVELVGKDILSFDITMDRLFGNYPIIGIENTKGGEVQLVLDHEVDESKVGIALVDLQFKGGVPQSPKILINGGSLDLDKDSSHVLIPAPILTIVLSIFS